MSFVRRAVVGSIAAVAMTAALAAIMVPVRTHLSVATTALVLVVPVVVGVGGGRLLAGVFAVVSGFLVFDYVFIPPYDTLNVGSAENWMALVVYVVVMLLVASVVRASTRHERGASARGVDQPPVRAHRPAHRGPPPGRGARASSSPPSSAPSACAAWPSCSPPGAGWRWWPPPGRNCPPTSCARWRPCRGWWPAWASRRAAGTWRRQWRCRPRGVPSGSSGSGGRP